MNKAQKSKPQGAIAATSKRVVAVALEQPLRYPAARRGSMVDDYHGVKVADPYRWLEDPDSEQTRRWVKAEQALSTSYLEKIPERAAIRARLKVLWNYEKVGVPVQEGGRLFYTLNPGLLNQARLMWRTAKGGEAKGGEERLLLDPNTLSKDGTAALASWSVSKDGKLLAYAISTSGSDWMRWRVREVDTGKDRSDEIAWSKFSDASWSADSSGFYYAAYDAPSSVEEEKQGTNFNQKLYFHRLGEAQAKDRLIYARKDHKEWGFSGEVSEDGSTLLIQVWKGTAPENQLFTLDLLHPKATVVERLSGFDASYDVIAKRGSLLYLRTTKDAPRARVVVLQLSKKKAQLMEVIPQAKDPLESVQLIGGTLVATYLHDASHRLLLFKPKGTQPARALGSVVLPTLGSVAGLRGHADKPEAYLSFTSFTYPTTVFRLNVAQQAGPTAASLTVYRQPSIDFDPADFETHQIFVASKDGTRIPAFITQRKGLSQDGQRPTYLYGYGGFNISLTPYYSTANLVWMEQGGVFVSANLRGGGEYGEAWHDGGRLLNKQNVFDDFMAIARFLVASKITSVSRLSIGGGSNGGLLVGACLTQHPELFGAAVAQVGVMDMLRYQRFTIGWAWASDYGSSDDPKLFPTLYAYSPYHRVREGQHYPPTLITTADHDDRVVPGHSFKFAAAMQHAQAGQAPVLIRIESKAGHGAGKPTEKILDEVADRWAFLAKALGGFKGALR